MSTRDNHTVEKRKRHAVTIGKQHPQADMKKDQEDLESNYYDYWKKQGSRTVKKQVCNEHV
jgi:hypothetical protein